jgi:hypothetical protein
MHVSVPTLAREKCKVYVSLSAQYNRKETWGLCLSQYALWRETDVEPIAVSVPTTVWEKCWACFCLCVHWTYFITVIATEMCSMEYVSKTSWSPCRSFSVFPQEFETNAVTPPPGCFLGHFSHCIAHNLPVSMCVGTASVILWSEFLATDPDVPGWIPGATRFSEKYWVCNGVHSASWS